MVKKALLQNIQEKISITEKEFDLCAVFFQYTKIKKKQKLIEEGESNEKLYFLEKGLLFSYKILHNGNIQVIQFAKEDYWISDLCSFFSNSKTIFSIQAIEDCELWAISKKEFDLICKQFPAMETFFRLNFQTAYIHTLMRLSDAYSQDANYKYNKLRSEQADILQRVPQYLIASYLGILPSSLSRLRKKKL